MRHSQLLKQFGRSSFSCFILKSRCAFLFWLVFPHTCQSPVRGLNWKTNQKNKVLRVVCVRRNCQNCSAVLFFSLNYCETLSSHSHKKKIETRLTKRKDTGFHFCWVWVSNWAFLTVIIMSLQCEVTLGCKSKIQSLWMCVWDKTKSFKKLSLNQDKRPVQVSVHQPLHLLNSILFFWLFVCLF